MLDARIRRFAVGEATIWRTSSAVAVTLTAVASSGTRLAVGGMMAARWITTSTPARAVGQNDESQMLPQQGLTLKPSPAAIAAALGVSRSAATTWCPASSKCRTTDRQIGNAHV